MAGYCGRIGATRLPARTPSETLRRPGGAVVTGATCATGAGGAAAGANGMRLVEGPPRVMEITGLSAPGPLDLNSSVIVVGICRACIGGATAVVVSGAVCRWMTCGGGGGGVGLTG